MPYCIKMILSDPALGREHGFLPDKYPKYLIAAKDTGGQRTATWTQNPEHATGFESEEAAHHALQSLNLGQFRPLADVGKSAAVVDQERDIAVFHAERCRTYHIKLLCRAGTGGPAPADGASTYPFYYAGQANGTDIGKEWTPKWTGFPKEATVFTSEKQAAPVLAALGSWPEFNCREETLILEEHNA